MRKIHCGKQISFCSRPRSPSARAAADLVEIGEVPIVTVAADQVVLTAH